MNDEIGLGRKSPSGRLIELICMIGLIGLGMQMAALGIFTWPAADDFCNIANVTQSGVLAAVAELWMQWSGRLATSFVLYEMFDHISPGRLPWASAMLGGSTVLAAWLVAKLTGLGEGAEIWPARLLITVLLIFCILPLAGQTVLWPTGGVVYHLALLYCLAWLCMLANDVRVTHAPRRGWLRVLAGVVAGNLMELLWPVALACIVSLWRRRYSASLWEHPLFLSVAGWGGGAFLLAIAPGNMRRADATSGSFSPDIGAKLHTYVDLLESVFSSPAGGGLVLVCLMTLMFMGLRRRRGPDEAVLLGPSPRAAMLGAMLSVTPMVLVPGQIAPRNAYFLVVFLIIACAAAFRNWSVVAAQRQTGIWLPALAGAVGLSWMLSGTITLQREAFVMLEARQAEILDAAPGHKVSVAPLDYSRIPGTLHFVEFSRNEGDFPNTCIAQVFGLPGIALR